MLISYVYDIHYYFVRYRTFGNPVKIKNQITHLEAGYSKQELIQ